MRPARGPSMALLLGATVVLTAALPPLSAGAEPQPCRQIRGQETPEDPADDVSVCRQDTWVHQAEQRLGNLAGFGQGGFPSWNTTQPAQAMSSGAGAGYVVAPPVNGDALAHAYFQGTRRG